MKSILLDAILCVTGHGRPSAQSEWSKQKARTWIEQRDPAGVFSFDAVCKVLGLDTARLRRTLLRGAFEARENEQDD